MVILKTSVIKNAYNNKSQSTTGVWTTCTRVVGNQIIGVALQFKI